MNVQPSSRPRAAIVLLGALALLGLGGCGSGGDDDDCQQDPPNPNADGGGLVCGQPFELNEPNGDPGVFGVKVVEYVHVNAAGIVETDTISQLLVLAERDREVRCIVLTGAGDKVLRNAATGSGTPIASGICTAI